MRVVKDLAQLQLVIFEPNHAGHYLRYAAAVVEASIEAGLGRCEFWTSREGTENRFVQGLLAHHPRRVDVRVLAPEAAGSGSSPSGMMSLIAASFRRWRLYHRIAEKSCLATPSIVFVPYLDGCWPALATRADPFPQAVAWGGIVMRPRFHHTVMDVPTPPRRRDALDRLLWRATLRRERGCIFTLDPFFERYVRIHWPEVGGRVRHLVDPVGARPELDRMAAREALGIGAEALVLLVYGVIDERKGLRLLASVAGRADLPDETQIVVAGKGAGELQSALLGNAPNSITIVDRFIEINEEHILFAAADVVWLAYSEHYGPSAVLVQAASAGIPVLARDEGIIGRLVRDHQLGFLVESPSDVTQALRRLLRLRGQNREAPRLSPGPFAQFTTEQFRAQLRESILIECQGRSAAGRAAAGAESRWSW